MLDTRNYDEYGCEPGQINRKTWTKNWRMKLFWSSYFDVQMDYVKKPLEDYCKSNNVEYQITCDWFYCISNRKQYNDIMRIVDSILYKQYEDEWDE